MKLPFLNERIKEFENMTNRELLELSFDKTRKLFQPNMNPRDLPTTRSTEQIEKSIEDKYLTYADVLVINNILLERLEKND